MKLALYAAGRGQVTHEDVDAIVGDSAEIAVETFVYAVSGGETKEALRQLDRLAGFGHGSLDRVKRARPAFLAAA